MGKESKGLLKQISSNIELIMKHLKIEQQAKNDPKENAKPKKAKSPNPKKVAPAKKK